MLNFIYGRAGSGKTTKVNSLISSLVKNDGRQVVYVVPEQFSFTSERKMLELLGPVDCNKVEIVMSFTHLADSVFGLYGANSLPSLDKSSKSILMSLAIDSVSDRLEIYSNKAQYFSFIKEMASLSTDFRRSKCSSEMLEKALGQVDDELLKKKLGDISLIFEAYDSFLDGNYYDPDDRLTVLSRVLAEHPFFEGKTVFIDGFTGYTQQEYGIIEKMLIQAEDVYVCVCTDKLYASPDDRLNVFAPSYETVRNLMRIAKNNNVPISNGEITLSEKLKSPEIEFLEEHFLENDGEVFSNCKNIEIIRAKNKIEECDYVASEVKRLLKQGYRCREIAIVSRNSGNYEDYMKTALSKCGVPAFFDKRSPVIRQPLCAFISYALSIASKGINQDNIFGYLKTGLAGLELEEISKIENYVLMWNIKSSGWKKPFIESPYGFSDGRRPDTQEKLDELNQIRLKIITPIVKFINSVKGRVDAKTFSKSVYDLLCGVNAQENLKKIAVAFNESGDSETALLQQRVWDCVMDVLNDVANIVGTNKKTVEEYETVINIALASQDLGNLPQGLDEVIVGDIMKTRTDSPKIVFVLGVNEDVFPSYRQAGTAFSNREKELLRQAGLEIAETLEEQYCEERFLGYRTFCSTREKLYLSFSDYSMDSTEMQSSEFITEIRQLFPDVVERDLSCEDKMTFVESDVTAFRLLTKKWNDTDSLSSSLFETLAGRQEFSDVTKCIESMSQGKEYRIQSDEISEKLFGKTMYESPSRVETFHKCRFQYFCRYGIKANKLERSTIDPRQRGNVIHYSLEKLIKTYGMGKLCLMENDELVGAVKDVLSDYADEFMGGMSSKSERFRYLYSSFEKTVMKLVKRLIEEFSQSKFEPVDFELSIDRDGAIKPYEIVCPDSTVISLRGKVDRVDSFKSGENNYIRIVDYKTGNKNFVLSDVFYGLNMQMLVYLFSIWENGAERYGKVMPAGVLYMPSGDMSVTADRNESDDEIIEKHNKNAKMKGVILKETEIVEAMGEKYISAKISSKTHKPSGDVLSLNQLKNLKNVIDEKLINMALSLHEGSIEATPIEGEDYKNICEYCDYRDVCLIEDSDERMTVKKTSFSETASALSAGEESDETEEEDDD